MRVPILRLAQSFGVRGVVGGYLFLRTRTAILISAVFQRPASTHAYGPTLALGAGDDDDELEY